MNSCLSTMLGGFRPELLSSHSSSNSWEFDSSHSLPGTLKSPGNSCFTKFTGSCETDPACVVRDLPAQGDGGQVLCKLRWLLGLLADHRAAWCCLPGVISLLQLLVMDVNHTA